MHQVVSRHPREIMHKLWGPMCLAMPGMLELQYSQLSQTCKVAKKGKGLDFIALFKGQ